MKDIVTIKKPIEEHQNDSYAIKRVLKHIINNNKTLYNLLLIDINTKLPHVKRIEYIKTTKARGHGY